MPSFLFDFIHLLRTLVAVACLLEMQQGRRIWVHEFFSYRSIFGEYHHAMPQLRLDDDKFYKYLRMSQDKFDYLLEKLRPRIQKELTNYREPIGAEERLVVTLR